MHSIEAKNMMMMAKDPEHSNNTNLANGDKYNHVSIEVNCFRSINVSSNLLSIKLTFQISPDVVVERDHWPDPSNCLPCWRSREISMFEFPASV